jgi:hypothetical protein
MLTKRTFLMTATGLLIGYAAAAQSIAPDPNAGPTPVNLLSLVTWGVAAVVLLMAVLTAGSLAGAGRARAAALSDAAVPAPEAAATATATIIPTAAVAAPVPAVVAAAPRVTAEPALV